MIQHYLTFLGHRAIHIPDIWRRCRGRCAALDTASLGLGFRYLGLVLLAFAVGTSSLTFNWIIEHRLEANFFPEFAGRVVYLSDILLFAGLVLWAIGWGKSPCKVFRYGLGYVFLPILVLVILMVLSIVWASDAGQAGYSALRWVFLLAMYLVMANESRRAFKMVVTALIAVGLLQAGVSLGQVSGSSAIGLPQLGEVLNFPYWSPRGYGLGFNPNPVGLFLAVVSVLAYGLYLTARHGWWIIAFTIIPFSVIYLGLRVTGSRSAILGWILAVVVVGLLAWVRATGPRKKILKRLSLAALVILLAEAYIHLPLLQRITDRPAVAVIASSGIQDMPARATPDEVRSGLAWRVEDAKLSLPVIRANFLLGVGTGNYPQALKRNLSPGTFGGIYTPVHNVPLLVVAELGVIGGMAWILLAIAPLLWIVSSRKAMQVDPYALVWLGPLLAILMVSIFDFPPWATQDGRVLFVAVLGLWSGSAVTVPSPD